MRYDKLLRVKEEMARLSEAIKEVEDSVKDDDKIGYYVPASKYSGAVRRASMDLTRALANLRKSN